MAAATSERNDEIVGALNIIEDIISRLDSLGDTDCVEGMAIRFDVLKRFLVNIRIDDIICQNLNQFVQRELYSAMNNSAFPEKVYTGCRGKPSYDIHEGQLNFLLEQGFKVSEVSSMMGVSKRTLERRMRSFGMSVSGKKVISSLKWLSNTVYVKTKSTNLRKVM
jgi:AraC-like DNA-binding protein